MEDTDGLTFDQFQIVRRELLNTSKIIEYLRNQQVLNDYHVEELSQKPETDKVQYLCIHLHRRGGPAFRKFLDALVITNQVALAKKLDPTIDLDELSKTLRIRDPSSGDGNCLSGSSEPQSQSHEPRLLEPPSQEAIEENERFYHDEKSLYEYIEVPQTDGLLTDLRVTMCKELPAAYKKGECYPHLSKPKGLAIIISNRNFNKHRSGVSSVVCLPERVGTDVDCRNMETLLTQLGYDVKVKTNLTCKEMLDTMSRFAFKSEHDRCDSAVVVVLTHGTNGQLYGCDGDLVHLSTFFNLLNARHCPGLKNKPKLFIIQACRGDTYDEGIDGSKLQIIDDQEDGESRLERIIHLRQVCEKDVVDAAIAKTPTDADFLIAYATTPGFVSWRNTVRGSWFIQAICKIFANHAHDEEILHLFTKVNRMVAEQLSGTGHKQVPEPASRLTKKFYLLPGLYK